MLKAWERAASWLWRLRMNYTSLLDRSRNQRRKITGKKKKTDTWHIWRSQGRQGAKVLCGLGRGQSWCLNGPSHTDCRFVENPDSVMWKRLKPFRWIQQWTDQCVGQFQHRRCCNGFKWILEFITCWILLLPSHLTPPNPRNSTDKVMLSQFPLFQACWVHTLENTLLSRTYRRSIYSCRCYYTSAGI